jgi:hypothetical protein
MNQPEGPAPSLVSIYRAGRGRIPYLQFTVEACDGVATLTTVDARDGRVQLTGSPGTETDARSLMEHGGPWGDLGGGRLERKER